MSLVAPALQTGATIAFISGSDRLNDVFPAAISRASALFQRHGYQVKELYTKDNGTLQSSISIRYDEIRQAFLDPAIKAIICTIGGGAFTQILPSLMEDTELHAAIRKDPKIVVGMSDMTGLHWFLNSMTGLKTFYGPSIIPELGTADDADDAKSPLNFCFTHLIRAITSSEPIGDIARSEIYATEAPPFFGNPDSTDKQSVASTPKWYWIREGKAQGRLFGGCIPVVVRLNGIKHLSPNWKGRIVFLETSMGEAEDISMIQTGVADLIAQGVFDDAAGLVVGRAFGYDSEERRNEFVNVFKQLLCDGKTAISKNPFPILCNVDIGHTTPMVTLPFDALAELDSENDSFKILDTSVA